MEWYRQGHKKEEWPDFQKTDSWTILIVAKDGKCVEYEQDPIAIPTEDEFIAWGNGRQFAIGALAMGANSVEAVEITSHHCSGCGRGVDSFDASFQKK